jgi:hypothetical protein
LVFGVAVLAAICFSVFAGAASANVSGVQVAVGETTVTVSGFNQLECLVELNVFDVATEGDVYWGWSYAGYGPFTETFTNLVPGTAYGVEIWSNCDERVVFSTTFVAGANPPVPQGPDRYIYCAAAGNTDANGNPLGIGQTLNLKWGEPAGDKHYTGATLGFWVQGVGLTCQLTPAQAALAAASTVKVNHTGAPNSQEGDPVYTFVPA